MKISKIFEIIQNDINYSINESLGISEIISSESKRVCSLIEKDIQATDKKLIDSGVGYKNGNTKLTVFENMYTIKGKYVFPIQIDFRWEYYNFRDNFYKEKFLDKNGIQTGGDSVLILNQHKRKNGKYENAFINLMILSLSGQINENHFIDTISHELRHLLEVDIPSKQFSDLGLMSLVKTNLNSSNKTKRLISKIIYICNKHEITAFVQGFYDFINIEKWKYGSVDKAVEHSESYNMLISLKELINEAKQIQQTRDFIDCVNEYSKYNINSNNFIKNAERIYYTILNRIGKAIIKAKENFIYEGLNSSKANYFNFNTSFYRKL